MQRKFSIGCSSGRQSVFLSDVEMDTVSRHCMELTWFNFNHLHPLLYCRSPRNCHNWTPSRGNFSTSNSRVESNECHVTLALYESSSTVDVSGATCVKDMKDTEMAVS